MHPGSRCRWAPPVGFCADRTTRTLGDQDVTPPPFRCVDRVWNGTSFINGSNDDRWRRQASTSAVDLSERRRSV